MNGLNTKSNTMAWLESQVGLLDILIESVSTHTDTDTKLLECIEGHRKWLESELKVLQNPDKYRLSGYAKQIVYPLLSDATAMRV